ncbi:ABC transporter ATP-binding protein [Streptomyces synnematoformans]|uniref:ABC transporter ATP-binding protein n=1 Tax=Streptomyces synnematoformans TaxID=415721 RepID=A0ABP5IXW4_9ACTN
MTRFDLLRPARVPLAAAVALQTLAGLLTLLPLLALVAFTDAWIAGDPTPGTGVVVAAVAGPLGAALASAAATWLTHRADADLTWQLQRRLAAAVRRAPVPAVTGLGAARIKKVVHDDTAALHYLVAHTLLDATALVVTPVAGLIALTLIDVRLAVCALLPLGLGVWWYVRAMRGSGTNFAAYAGAQQRINTAIVDYVRGLPTAKIYGSPGGARTRYDGAVHTFHDFFRAWSRSTSAVTTASWLVVTPGVTAVLLAVVGGFGLALDRVSPAAFVAGVLLGPAISAPVAVAGPRLQAVRTGLSALASLADFLDQRRLTWGDTTPQAGGRVHVENVTYHYSDDRPVLHRVSFGLPERGLVALVGSSGSGKSTLASLLARFDDPASGRILLVGTDLRDLREAALYERIAYVFQDTDLRRATIRDNLTGGRPLDDGRVVEAARKAAVHDDILALPHGYDSVLGDDTDLSGGQRQRICLARALLREPALLVLDETLSALDPTTRTTLLATLHDQARHRAVLLITHQLHLVRDADRILVLDHGRLADDGTHPELLDRCTAYRTLAGAGPGTGVREGTTL